jgi:CSLREA domain-containing protein
MLARVAAALVVLGLLMTVAAAPVAAAGLTVNSLADGAPADDGTCTLREAIISANTDTASGAMPGECIAGAGTDTISFSGTGFVALASALPAITSDLSILGGGVITVTGSGAYQVFNVSAGTVTLSGLLITGGSTGGPGAGIANSGTLNVTGSSINSNTAGGPGGGILNDGTLTVTNTIISSNTAVGGGGISNSGTLNVTDSVIAGNTALGSAGGISNIVGTATITGSVIAGNTAAGAAGGIGNANGGTLTVTNSTISGNTAEDGDGGGIANQPFGSTLTVVGSTIDSNTASTGGGISNDLFGTATITNSTISGNSTDGAAGGIANSATITITNSTISANSTLGVAGGLYGIGTDTVVNTIIAGNTAGVGDDVGDNLETVTTSLIGVPSGLTLANILSPAGLADNGGPTWTIALVDAASNPAIDTATSAVCASAPVSAVDQRGLPRPAACDIGAFEIQPPLPDAAMATPSPLGPWAAFGFAALLLGSLAVLAFVNVRGTAPGR